jgi:hypothetical protein
MLELNQIGAQSLVGTGSHLRSLITHTIFLKTQQSTSDVPGATLTWTNGISGAGQIVENFRDAGGEEHGFVAT